METRRPVNPAAEEILGGYFPVLDHGFVALVDYMGTDETVERAARVSYGHGTRARSDDEPVICVAARAIISAISVSGTRALRSSVSISSETSKAGGRVVM